MSIMTKLTFIKKQQENNDIYTFFFTPKTAISHKAGQHGLFLLPGLYRPHPFTLSSAPGEEYITFSTHTATGSKFKQRIMEMKEGDLMFLVGPILNFTFAKDKNKYVFLAQGIGITPFRSMLVDAHAKSLPYTTTLVHVDSKSHTFKNETHEYASFSYYPSNSEEFRVFVEIQDKNQMFYLSGSPKFISSTKKLLVQKDVGQANIKTDSFFGY